MFGLNELKHFIKITEIEVECPVKGCTAKVERQRKSFKREQNYQCPVHKIFISPTTFEYETECENLLWYNDFDKQLFEDIKKVKRESRIARDNSEDALTWNVFRFLDRQGLLREFLCQLSQRIIHDAELILWSYSPKEKSNWSLLNAARTEFGETVARGSEPDIIIKTDQVLYFFEAKLTAFNKTKPRDPNNRKQYETGGSKLFQHIFKSDFHNIAVTEERYELMRYWILGNWMAMQSGLSFEFYSLVTQSRENDLESEFDKHIIETPDRKFTRLTWEQIYEFVKSLPESNEKQIMTEYFKNKTIGYSSDGTIIKAFNV